MKRLLSLSLLMLGLTPIKALAATCPPGSVKNSVLVTQCTSGFGDYISKLLNTIIPEVLFIALLMIVFSGVQWMLSGTNPEAQKAARQRIIGILSGVIFFLLMRLILNQLASNIKI